MGGDLSSPWLQLDVPRSPRGSLEGRRTADAVVVGAGMTGIGLACFLGRKGVRAAVLDRGSVAEGATGRNAGLLISGLGEHYARSVDFWGRDLAGAIMRLHRENQDLLAQWVDQYGIDCGYRRKGSFAVGTDSAEEEILRRSRLQMEQDGFPCTFLEASEINSSIGGSSFFGGIFNPSDGVVDPVRLVRGLAAAAETSGTRIFERSPVEGIVREGGAWTARTPRGCVSAPLLFLAANAWVPSLRRRIPVSPVRGQCCAMVSAKGVPPDTAFMSNYGAEYWRRAGDLVILGGFRRLGGPAEATHEEGVTGCLQSALAEFASARFPSLRGAPVSYRWSGIMAYTRDGLPLVGPLPGEEGLYFAGGYTGHGFGYAFVAARWLAELAFGGRDEIAPFCRLTRRMRPCPALHEI